MVQRYTKEFLGRRATPHSLRHTALTILARGRGDIATVAQIGGARRACRRRRCT
ncbi:site-specific recombinase XerD, partial [Saccharomonospora azurea SZMC 14600]